MGREGWVGIVITWASQLLCSVIEFVFLGKVFAVVSHSGLEGFSFQLPFALKGDVASGISQV